MNYGEERQEDWRRTYRWALIGATSGDTNRRQGLYFNPNSASIFETFASFMQQQQIKEYKEAIANKALYVVVDKIDQLERKNITKYLKYYIKEMELKYVPKKEMIQLFE